MNKKIKRLIEYTENEARKGFKVFFVINEEKEINLDKLSLQKVANGIYTLTNTITFKAPLEELLKAIDVFIGVEIRKKNIDDCLFWAVSYLEYYPVINEDIYFEILHVTDDHAVFIAFPKDPDDTSIKDYIASVLLGKEVTHFPSEYPLGNMLFLEKLFRKPRKYVVFS